MSRTEKMWEDNIKDWNLAILSNQLKIEKGGDALTRRHQ